MHYTYQMYKADLFRGIMTTLAQNLRLRHLTLRLPNSSHSKDDALDVLRKFETLETLELIDARDWEPPSVFEQVAALKNLKQVTFSFSCRSPSEAACKAALPKMKQLESATFSDGRPHIQQGWEETLTKFAGELIANRKMAVIELPGQKLVFKPTRDDITVGCVIFSLYHSNPGEPLNLEAIRVNGTQPKTARLYLKQTGKNQFELPALKIAFSSEELGGPLYMSLKVWFNELTNQKDGFVYEHLPDRYA
ncbi:MAG: hypothetical protein O3C40_11240, partial [Planctomycetota bacterium]|nr:hypothetical protein [Planctomycetota bacterium]